jgi:hypothetical protein
VAFLNKAGYKLEFYMGRGDNRLTKKVQQRKAQAKKKAKLRTKKASAKKKA